MRIAGLILLSVVAAARPVRLLQEQADQLQPDATRTTPGPAELPPLQAPAGLEAPDTRNALKVPPLNTPERVRGKDEPCLDIPPPFASPKASPKGRPGAAEAQSRSDKLL